MHFHTLLICEVFLPSASSSLVSQPIGQKYLIIKVNSKPPFQGFKFNLLHFKQLITILSGLVSTSWNLTQFKFLLNNNNITMNFFKQEYEQQQQLLFTGSFYSIAWKYIDRYVLYLLQSTYHPELLQPGLMVRNTHKPEGLGLRMAPTAQAGGGSDGSLGSFGGRGCTRWLLQPGRRKLVGKQLTRSYCQDLNLVSCP